MPKPILVKFDPTIIQSDIIVPLTNSSVEESGDDYQGNKPEVQQTAVYGIHSPLIMINNIVVDFSDVIYFELNGDSTLPRVSMTVRDRCNLISTMDTPGVDNELRVQILPKFEDKYRKVNLTFYITSMSITDGEIDISGTYKSPKFTSSNIRAFGEVCTYNIFNQIATETGLGFATNTEENENDKRWMYCDNKSYQDLLTAEISRSGSDNLIYDYWVDWYNYLILIDMYDRYTSIDPDTDENLKLWISGQNHEIGEGSEIQPQLVVRSLTNHPSMKNNELYFESMSILNSPGGASSNGTDRVYSVYSDQNKEYMDYLIQDGDVHKDIYAKFEYLGEVYGNYDYLLAGKKRDTFLSKINTNETIEVMLKTPLLGIMRGSRTNVLYYINDSRTENLQNTLAGENLTNEPVTDIPLDAGEDIEDKTPDGHFILDKTISGQYLITKTNIQYQEGQWEYIVTLSRPTSSKPKLFKTDE